MAHALSEDFEDEFGLAASFVMAFTVAAVSTAIIGAAIAWNAVSLASSAVQALRRR